MKLSGLVVAAMVAVCSCGAYAGEQNAQKIELASMEKDAAPARIELPRESKYELIPEK